MTCGIAAGNRPAQIVDNLLLHISAVDKASGCEVTGNKQIVNNGLIRAVGSGFRVNEHAAKSPVMIQMPLHRIIGPAGKGHQLIGGLKQLRVRAAITHSVVGHNGGFQIFSIDSGVFRQLLNGFAPNEYAAIGPGCGLVHLLGPKKLAGASPESILALIFSAMPLSKIV